MLKSLLLYFARKICTQKGKQFKTTVSFSLGLKPRCVTSLLFQVHQ